mmetsp:Transcript_4443/g.16771  ORF Transcript_4443/g.16771 Transcript_4443/m.16771 type:complete len:113 (-) Transcript_4443:717-1055(-)
MFMRKSDHLQGSLMKLFAQKALVDQIVPLQFVAISLQQITTFAVETGDAQDHKHASVMPSITGLIVKNLLVQQYLIATRASYAMEAMGNALRPTLVNATTDGLARIARWHHL